MSATTGIDELSATEAPETDEDPYHVYLLRRPHERASTIVPQLPKQPEMANTRLRYRRIGSGSFNSLGGHFPAPFEMPNRQSQLDSLTSDDETGSFAVISRRSWSQMLMTDQSKPSRVSSPKTNKTKKKRKRRIRRSSASTNTNTTGNVFSDDEITRRPSTTNTLPKPFPQPAPPTVFRLPRVPVILYEDCQFFSSAAEDSDDDDSPPSTPLSTSPTTPVSGSPEGTLSEPRDVHIPPLDVGPSKRPTQTPRRRRGSQRKATSDAETDHSTRLREYESRGRKKDNRRPRGSKKSAARSDGVKEGTRALTELHDGETVRKMHSYHSDASFGMTVSYDGRPISAPSAMRPELRQNFVLRPESPIARNTYTSTPPTEKSKRSKEGRKKSSHVEQNGKKGNSNENNRDRVKSKVVQKQEKTQQRNDPHVIDWQMGPERDRELSVSFAHRRFSAEEAAAKPLNAIQRLWQALAFARSVNSKLSHRKHN